MREPTQQLMDEKCRSRDPAYLPFRVVHLVKAWYFAIVLMPVVPFAVFPLVVYHFLSFVVDRYNMLCALEPLPPSSGLCMRFVVTILLPCTIPLHYLVGIIGYLDANDCGQRNDDGSFIGCVREETEGKRFTAEVLLFVIGGALLNIYLVVETIHLQGKKAEKRGMMTTMRVLKVSK